MKPDNENTAAGGPRQWQRRVKLSGAGVGNGILGALHQLGLYSTNADRIRAELYFVLVFYPDANIEENEDTALLSSFFFF